MKPSAGAEVIATSEPPTAAGAYPASHPTALTAMFRYEVSFTLAGSTRLMVEVKAGNAPWEATD